MRYRWAILLVVLFFCALLFAPPSGPQRFNDEVFMIYDNADASKLANFEASGISGSTIRTYTFPDASGTLLLSSGAVPLAGAWNMGNQALTNVNVDNGSIDNVAIGANTECTVLEVDYFKIDSYTLETESGNMTIKAAGGDISFDDEDLTTTGNVVMDEFTETSKSYVRVTQTSVDAISTATWTTWDFDTEEYDTESEFNTTTDQFTPGVAGYYYCSMTIVFRELGDGKTYIGGINKNGTRVCVARGVTGAASANAGVSCSTIVYMNGSTDYLYVQGYHNHGSNRDTLISGGYQVFVAYRISK